MKNYSGCWNIFSSLGETFLVKDMVGSKGEGEMHILCVLQFIHKKMLRILTALEFFWKWNDLKFTSLVSLIVALGLWFFFGNFSAKCWNPAVLATSFREGPWSTALGLQFCITAGGSLIAGWPSNGVMMSPWMTLHGLALDCPSIVITDCVECEIEESGISITCPTAGSTNVIPDWSSIIARPS